MGRMRVPAGVSGCAHHFCFDCIKQWAEAGTNACPVCREYFQNIFKLSDRKPVKVEDREISDGDSDLGDDEYGDLLSGDICMLCGEESEADNPGR